MRRVRRGWIAELVAVALILASVAGSLGLVVEMHRRAARLRRSEAKAETRVEIAVVDPAPPPKVEPLPPPPPPAPPPPPPPAPPPIDPTPKAVAQLAGQAEEERRAAREADRKAAAYEVARQAAVAESERWRRRETLVRSQVDELDARARTLEQQADALARERDVLARERDAAKVALDRAREKGGGYAVLPHKGANGTWQKPVVIECKNGTAILQPRGVPFTMLDLSPLGPRTSPFVAAVARELMKVEDVTSPDGAPVVPYIYFLVRPDGIRPYYEARARLEPLGIAFGYELVEQDWEIDFPDASTWDGNAPTRPGEFVWPSQRPGPEGLGAPGGGGGGSVAGHGGNGGGGSGDGRSPYLWPTTPPPGLADGGGTEAGGDGAGAGTGGSGRPGVGGGLAGREPVVLPFESGSGGANGGTTPRGGTGMGGPPSGRPGGGGFRPDGTLGGGVASRPGGFGTGGGPRGGLQPGDGVPVAPLVNRFLGSGPGARPETRPGQVSRGTTPGGSTAPTDPLAPVGAGSLPQFDQAGSGVGLAGPAGSPGGAGTLPPGVVAGNLAGAGVVAGPEGVPGATGNGTGGLPPGRLPPGFDPRRFAGIDPSLLPKGIDPKVLANLDPSKLPPGLDPKVLARLASSGMPIPRRLLEAAAAGGSTASNTPTTPDPSGRVRIDPSQLAQEDEDEERPPAPPTGLRLSQDGGANGGGTGSPPIGMGVPSFGAAGGSPRPGDRPPGRSGTPAPLIAPKTVDVPLDLVVACRADGVVLHPGGYRLSVASLKREKGLKRDLETIVRNHELIDPLVRPHPRIKFIVERGGAETYAEARRQTILSGLDWPVSIRVVETSATAARLLPKERF